MERKFALGGAVLAALGVAAGAFGAHGLKGVLSPEMLAVFQPVDQASFHAFLPPMCAGPISSFPFSMRAS